MPHESALTPAMRGLEQIRGLDARIAKLAERQHGVVSRSQLTSLHVGGNAIDRRLRDGRLHLLYRGVYAVGHRLLSREGRWMTAVLFCGPGGVLSHRSAAALWGIRRGPSEAVDITAPSKSRSSGGIHRHCSILPDDEITTRRRIPVTTLTRTLFDIAAMESIEGMEGAIREAEYLHRFRVESLESMLERHAGRRGAATLRACFQNLDRGALGRTRSELEARFVALLVRTDLPRPHLNALIDIEGFRIEADCLWRDQRVIAELDGGKAHRTRVAFESDRERDRRLQAAGWRVVRITWRQVDDPTALLRDLRRMLVRDNVQA